MKKKAKTSEPERRIYRDFTLDEFDEFTMEIRRDGAGEERGNIVSELQRRTKQLWELSDAAGLVQDRDVFAQRAAGMEMAISLIQHLRKYEDNVGCPECEAV